MRRLLTLAAFLIFSSMQAPADDRSDCLQHKDYDVRIKSCSEVIQRAPNDAVAYHNRGIAYQSKGDLEHAIADHSKALQLNPVYAAAYDSRGLAYAAKGDYTRALADVTRAAELAPKAVAKVTAAPAPRAAAPFRWKVKRVARAPIPRDEDIQDDAPRDHPKWDSWNTSPW